MAATTSALNDAADGIGDVITHMSLHDADPTTVGDNEVTGGGYARIPINLDAAAGGIASLPATLNFNGPASGTCTHFGFWTALTGGTFKGGGALTGDQAFNAAGEYNVTAATVTATAA